MLKIRYEINVFAQFSSSFIHILMVSIDEAYVNLFAGNRQNSLQFFVVPALIWFYRYRICLLTINSLALKWIRICE